MIQQKTVLKVSDNSGAKTVRCLKILKGFKNKFAKLGDIIIVSVKQLRNKSKKMSKVKKKELYQALIVRTKYKHTFYKKTAYEKIFNNNSVVLLNKQGNNLIGTRIFGPIPKNLKKTNFQKLGSISFGVI